MSKLQAQVNLLRREIDLLSQEIQKNLFAGQFLDLAALVDTRSNLIKNLMGFYSKDIDKAALKNYFLELYQRDQVLMQRICYENSVVETALLKVNKIARYSDSAVRGV